MRLKESNILIIDDDEDVLIALRLLLKSKVKEVVVNKNPNNILSLMQKHSFDVVVLDMNFNGLINTGNEGIFWLNKIKKQNPAVEVVLITAYADIDLAIRSLKQGASDFIIKPWKNDKFLASLENIFKLRMKAPSEVQADYKIIGESEVMQSILLKLNKIAPTDANILILGENGTGKDLIARAIHDKSLRKDMPFVKVDVGALTDTLFESELFGYKKGAFTDAREDRKGRFETAQGGSLFLDEIGNISLRQQAKLLTVIQNREVTPLGSSEAIPIDIRLICATNLPIEELSDTEKFRKDLMYRINTVDVTIPPLRNRGTDISLLATYFTKHYAEKYNKNSFSLGSSFIDKLKRHPFNGNVRELQYTIERAIIMSDKQNLEAEDLSFSAIEQSSSSSVLSSQKETNLEILERETILRVIDSNQGNISKSAKELGITRAALYRRLNKYDL